MAARLNTSLLVAAGLAELQEEEVAVAAQAVIVHLLLVSLVVVAHLPSLN
jgi:hypothetical protein